MAPMSFSRSPRPLVFYRDFPEASPAEAQIIMARAREQLAEERAQSRQAVRLNADEKRMFANLRPGAVVQSGSTTIKAILRGTSLAMPIFYPSREQCRARIAELDAELAAIHAERGQ